MPKPSTENVINPLSPYVQTWDQLPKSPSENDISQDPLPGQIPLPEIMISFHKAWVQAPLQQVEEALLMPLWNPKNAASAVSSAT